MPLHKRIYKRDLEEWLCYIKLVCNKILLNPDIIFVSHLIVSLFEYCQVFCYFKTNKIEDEAVDFKVTVNNIKVMLKDKKLYATANAFMQVRHSLSHGFISNRVKKAINSLLEDPDFMLLLRELDLDLNVIYCIEEVVFKFCGYNEIGLDNNKLLSQKKDLSSSDKEVDSKNNFPVSPIPTLDSIFKEAVKTKTKLNAKTGEKEKRFKEVLKSYGVTKCYVSEDFDFDSTYVEGEILVDVDDCRLHLDIYKIFTKDPDGILEDGQMLWVSFYEFKNRKPNYSI